VTRLAAAAAAAAAVENTMKNGTLKEGWAGVQGYYHLQVTRVALRNGCWWRFSLKSG